MILAFSLLVLAVVVQLLIGYQIFAPIRKPVAWFGLFAILASAIMILLMDVSIGSVANAFVTFYSIVNFGRVIYGRTDIQYLLRNTHRTATWLSLAHMLAAYFVVSASQSALPTRTYWYGLAAVQLAVAIIVLVSVRRQLWRSAPPATMSPLSDSHLPTVTVAVPVRNESGQLEACLTSILASNYPKLEILAFDDDSHDTTPDIIKSFAHSGVRFLRSSKPSGSWLAKNQAYQALAEAANGDYIIYCGADVRLGQGTIRQLVSLATRKHKHMVSVAPLNRSFKSVPALQALRYYWELAPPRRLFQRPPVLSSCWIIERRALQRYGGFAAARHSIAPEVYLARQAMHDNDGYSFIRANAALDICSEKAYADQQSTALIRRYPQIHRRPEMAALFSASQALLLVAPVGMVFAGIAGQQYWIVSMVAALAFGLHTIAFAMIQRRIFPATPLWQTYAMYLPAMMADIWFINASMLNYEFATVTWKGRDVSGPVMRWSAYASLRLQVGDKNSKG